MPESSVMWRSPRRTVFFLSNGIYSLAFAALGVGFVASALVLGLFCILNVKMSPDEWFGKVLLQMVPASIGAVVARKQLGGPETSEFDYIPAGSERRGGLFFSRNPSNYELDLRVKGYVES